MAGEDINGLYKLADEVTGGHAPTKIIHSGIHQQASRATSCTTNQLTMLVVISMQIILEHSFNHVFNI